MSATKWLVVAICLILTSLSLTFPIHAVRPATPPVNTDPTPISLDNDKDADFLDLTLILQNFNASQCKYKLLGSCLIDIFDYNLFIYRL